MLTEKDRLLLMEISRYKMSVLLFSRLYLRTAEEIGDKEEMNDIIYRKALEFEPERIPLSVNNQILLLLLSFQRDSDNGALINLKSQLETYKRNLISCSHKFIKAAEEGPFFENIKNENIYKIAKKLIEEYDIIEKY